MVDEQAQARGELSGLSKLHECGKLIKHSQLDRKRSEALVHYFTTANAQVCSKLLTAVRAVESVI